MEKLVLMLFTMLMEEIKARGHGYLFNLPETKAGDLSPQYRFNQGAIGAADIYDEAIRSAVRRLEACLTGKKM